MTRRLLFVIAGAFCCMVALATTASADDCDKLIKGIKDLADKGKLQDCTRTGGNWGKVVGVVVGGTGGAIAVGGVGKNGQAGTGETPCAQVARMQEELRQKSEALRKLHQDVVEGWQKRMRAHEILHERWQAIKDAESNTMQVYNWTKVRQWSKLAVAVYGLGRAVVAAGAARAAYTASAALGAATPAVAAKLTEAELLLLFSGIKDFADVDKLSDYWQAFMGSKEADKIWDTLLQEAAAYQRDANGFNREFREWANTKAAELRAAYADIAGLYQQMDAPFRECMKYAPPGVEQFMKASDQISEIPVHEAQTSFGTNLHWVVIELKALPGKAFEGLTGMIQRGLDASGHSGPLPTGRPPGSP